VAALLALRATTWEQVRVFVAAGITANLMSLIGAVYYIFFVGVVSTGLIILLAIYVVLTVGFVYAWRKYDRHTAGQVTGSSVKSA
jgi:ABC-type bacteriocin/lantibiotic exporter with double-glycine peptidase domain